MRTASTVNGQRSSGPALLFGLLVLVGCGGKTEQPPERIPDTVLAKSKLPNANAVGAALRLQDTAAARRAREDSVARAAP
ncbi:MAG TPA: hypothetical protein VIQ98_08315 [Gemmatimonadales bacterium]